ncbi:MAG: serine hydrolase domain-containing protein [Steroidobacteraceae bacterium]
MLLNEGVRQGIPGIAASIARPEGVLWDGTAGWANLQSEQPVCADQLFGIGSITKTFVAVVILQLVEERRLRLEDTPSELLGELVRDIPNADCATIAELLNHTSGVPSWEDNGEWIRDGRGQRLDVDRIWSKTAPLEYIRGQPPFAAPGEKFGYSNTNYTLLGLVIEQVTGEDAARAIRNRILEPLALNNVYLEGFEPLPAGRMPHRYQWATPDFHRSAGAHAAFFEVRPGLLDVSSSNLSVEWTAGGMVATAHDLALYGNALREGKLVQSRSMRFMTEWFPAGKSFQIGHNLIREAHPSGFALIGHDGGVLGFSATLYWVEGADGVVAAMCNVGAVHSGHVPQALNSVTKSAKFVEAARQLTRENWT